MISTKSIDVAMKEISTATWKSRGLVDLDPKGMGDEGYDGTYDDISISEHPSLNELVSEHVSASVDIIIPVDYRHSPQFELVVFWAEVL